MRKNSVSVSIAFRVRIRKFPMAFQRTKSDPIRTQASGIMRIFSVKWKGQLFTIFCKFGWNFLITLWIIIGFIKITVLSSFQSIQVGPWSNLYLIQAFLLLSLDQGWIHPWAGAFYRKSKQKPGAVVFKFSELFRIFGNCLKDNHETSIHLESVLEPKRV